ncbi:hypothetical protein D3C79_659620 [compost metagenome]
MLYSEEDWVINTTEIPARDITANTRAAMPTMPFIPGPDTLIIAILFRLVMPFTGVSSATLSPPIKVPGACGLAVFLIRQGIWNWAIGVMVRGWRTLAPK